MLTTESKPTFRFSDIAMESDLSQFMAAVVVTSDTCFADPKKDISGDYVVNCLTAMKFQKVRKFIVPDDKETISSSVMRFAEQPNNILIITVGGTGLCPRDVTPEATGALYQKTCPGISTALIIEGLKYSHHAALSRLTAGIYSNCLIVNFPGKTKACVECFGCLSRILSHALDQVLGDLTAVDVMHKKQQHDSKVTINNNQPTGDERKLPSEDSMLGLLSSCNGQSSVPAETPEELTAAPLISPPPRVKKIAKPSQTESDMPTVDSLLPTTISLPESKSLKNHSLYPLISFEEALSIMGSLKVCQTELSVKLDSHKSALSIVGDILAADVKSKVILPPFPASTMDGFVLNVPQGLKDVISQLGIIEAPLVGGLEEFEKLQRDPEQSHSFFCYQVNTGGQVPENNFAIVPVEKTAKIAKDVVTIAKVQPNQFVRKPGSDLCETDEIKAGTIIGPVELSLLLSMGCKNVTIVKRPTIGILSTGDELVNFHEYDNQKNPISVINTNGPLLTALFEKRGFPVVDVGMAKDNPRDILLKIHTGLKESDILIVTGGASMGSKDHVKDVVEQIGGIFHFGRINMKPGKPAALASLMVGGRRKFIFCLPGNPVSAYVTSLVLVLPFIEHGMKNNVGPDAPLTMEAIGDLISVEIVQITDTSDTGEAAYKFDGRLEFVRAQLSTKARMDSHVAIVSAKQQSSRLLNLKDFDCLILIDPSMKGSKFLVGQSYPALRLRS